MKKLFLVMLAVFSANFLCFSQTKILIAYYSQNGSTRKAAEKIAAATGGVLFEIVPQTPYPASHDPCLEKQVSDIKNDARPALKDMPPDISQFEKIFIGYPIWYYQAPLVVNTFLEAQDFSEKTLIPFCTSGGFPIERSVEKLKPSAKNARWKKGLRVSGKNGEIEKWLKETES